MLASGTFVHDTRYPERGSGILVLMPQDNGGALWRVDWFKQQSTTPYNEYHVRKYLRPVWLQRGDKIRSPTRLDFCLVEGMRTGPGWLEVAVTGHAGAKEAFRFQRLGTWSFGEFAVWRRTNL